jgi:DNA-binding protein YbaB
VTTTPDADQDAALAAAHDLAGALAAQRERSQAQLARYHQIRDVLEQLRVSASSADRSVTVELAAGGAIVDLRLTAKAMSKTPDTLASTILEAIRRGLAEVAERTAAEVEPLTGRRIDVGAVAQGRLPSLDRTDHPTSSGPVDSRFGPEEE